MKNTFIFINLYLFSIGGLYAQNISVENLKNHIAFLASDQLKGRAPGTSGEKKAADYIAKQFKQLGLAPKGTRGYFQPFTYRQSLNPHDTASLSGKARKGKNVIAFLDNNANSTVVIGAHFDHLGDDGRGNSLEKEAKGKIHNGADDNASGTAGVLELARYYSTNTEKEPVNFLFVCFSAEEAGLIGSKYFTNHPTLALSNINFMLNMDMIGRLVDSTQKLLIFGTGTSDAFEPTLLSTNKNRFQLVLDSSGIGPSDQTSFYLKKIPVLHFFTGQHSDYHKASDDIEKINFNGEARVLEFIIDVTNQLIAKPKLQFYQTRQKNEGNKTSFKVTLGIMPDYGFQGKGLRIDAVNKDKPAEKAGLKDGDIITKIGDFNIENIYDYMKALANFNKGQKTSLEFKRGNQPQSATVEF